MSSPCNNMSKLSRCRVRDFASCFYACQRLPVLNEEEPNNSSSPASKPLDGPTRVAGSEPAGGAHKPRKKSSGKEKSSVHKKSSNNSSRKESRVAENGNGPEPRFADEDYIVFCFTEDGRIDMIHNEGNNDNDNNNNNNKSSEACRDVIGDDGHERIICSTTKRSLTNGNQCPNDEIKEINSNELPNNGTQVDSFESCDSNLSDTSTSSFAFPSLGSDWIGSPVHMPKSEKPEARCLPPRCCKF